MSEKNFTDADDLRVHYRNLKERLYPKNTPAVVIPEKVEGPKAEDKKQENTSQIQISEEHLAMYRAVPVSPHKKLIRQIIAETEDKYKMTRGTLRIRSRKKIIVKARHEAMFRLNKEASCGASEISRIFEMDHTTIIHGIESHREKNNEA